MMRFGWAVLICLAVVGCNGGESAQAPEAPAQPTRPAEPASEWIDQIDTHAAIDEAHAATARRLIGDGVDFLLTQRDSGGGWSLDGQGAYRPAATAMVLKALVQSPTFDAHTAPVAGALAVPRAHRQDDGGIYTPGEGAKSYTTSIAVMALTALGTDDLQPMIRDAVLFLRGLQIVPGSESPDGTIIVDGDAFDGGVSYGPHGRPDLSNVGMWMQAMHDAGVSGDDPAMQRALAFVERTQNRSESNPMVWAAAGPEDGGHVYAPALADDPTMGQSQAGTGPGGMGLRSYGSMTYVGFKSMLYADVRRDDPRVRAAYDWIRRYWRLDANPNMPAVQSQEGLFYYYHVFAKALRVWGEDVITDADRVEHNWRHELIDALAERVGDDGSWINLEDRWQEGSGVLVTSYAVIALQEAARP